MIAGTVVPASPPPEASAVDRAELSGAHFEERKRFHFPWTSATRPLEAEQVAAKLEKGRVQALTPESDEPVPLRHMEEVEALADLQTDANDRARAVHALAEQDWKFHDALGSEASAYEAYNGNANACRDGLAVPMADPEAVWRYYDPARPTTAVELERQGFRFYEQGKSVAGPYATAQARLGKNEGWLRLDELTPGHEHEQLERFEKLRGLTNSAASVQAAWNAKPGDMDRLLAQGVPARLALEVGAPSDAQLWKQLATLPPETATEALRHMASRSDEARLALALAEAAPRHQKLLLQQFSQAPPDADRPDSLRAMARNFGNENAPFQRALLRAMLSRPTNLEALASQANLVTDWREREAALRELASRPECAGLRACQERWLPSLQNQESKQALARHLLQDPRMADDPATRADLARQLQSQLNFGPDKAAVARLALTETLAAEPDVSKVARLARDLNQQGQDVGPALEALAARPECAGFKACLDSWSPVLKSSPALRTLHGLLLSNPLLKNDLASRQGLGESFLQQTRYSLGEEMRRKFACKVQEEVVAGTQDVRLLSRQGLVVLDQGGDPDPTLKALAALPQCSGLKNLRQDWQPALTDPAGRKALSRQLLSNPTVADDPATRQSQGEALLQAMRYAVADPVRRKFAEKVQDELLAGPTDVKLLARQGLLVLDLQGDAGKTLDALQARRECAGLKAYRDGWGPALKTPEGLRALQRQLLSNPGVKADLATRQAQAEAFLQSNRYNLPVAIRRPFAEAVQDDLLASGASPRQIARAGLMVLDQEGSAARSVEALAARPECAGLKSCLDRWSPVLKTPEATRALQRQLLSKPRLADDLATRLSQAEEFLQSTRYSLAAPLRSSFAEAVQNDVVSSGGDAAQIARVGLVVLELGGSTSRSVEALAARPECAGLKACLDRWGPVLKNREATRALHRQLLSNPILPDGTETLQSQAEGFLGATRYSLAPEVRRTFATKALDDLVAGVADPRGIGRIAHYVMDLGGPADKTLDALAARPDCEGLRALRQEWRWEGMSMQARLAVNRALLSDPQTKITDEDWRRLGETVKAGLPAQERQRFEEILAAGPIRRDLEKMLNPDVSTAIDEQADALVVGGVVVKKRQVPEA